MAPQGLLDTFDALTSMSVETDWLLQAVLECSNDGILITDFDDRIVWVNSRLLQLIGHTAATVRGQSAEQMFSRLKSDALGEGSGTASTDGTPMGDEPLDPLGWQEVQLQGPDGSQFWADITSIALLDAQGTPRGRLVRVTNITELKGLEEYLRLLESVVGNASELVMIAQAQPTDDPLNLPIIYINTAFLQITGYLARDVMGQTPAILIGPDSVPDELQRLREHLCQATAIKVELPLYRQDGQSFWADINALPIHNERGHLTHFVYVMREITARKQAEEQLRRNAFHDFLTGLPNRLMFMDRLAQMVQLAQHDQQVHFAVLFLDLDRFKVINDSLGHLLGDQLLIAIARRLEASVQAKDLVARLGGDEFTILLDGVQDAQIASRVAERLHRALSQPFNLGDHEVFTSVSIGIVMSSASIHQAEDLLRGADIAMYRAKALGKSCHEVFDADMHHQVVTLMQLENDLRRAIERQEFQLYYQPIVSLTTGKIWGFEALVRWQHPERGLVSPLEFIPLAEENGLIIPLGEIVLRQACHQLRQWQIKFPQHLPLSVSVNLSSRQFSHPHLLEQIREILAETKLSPYTLKLEITESAIMENPETAMAMMMKIKDLGIQLSVDDFGTGYSSLSYLYRFPMDFLKIDRSFISRIDSDGEKLELVRTITTLAWNLGMDVVAEGVETTKQLAQLKAVKCEYGQGYLFSSPLCAGDIELFLSQPKHPLEHLAQVLPIFSLDTV
jgi:diguanylate cyclase (GGDEF)-like protein/PAS domain S-box-containing protein